MNKKRITPLLYDTYLAVIKNSNETVKGKPVRKIEAIYWHDWKKFQERNLI